MLSVLISHSAYLYYYSFDFVSLACICSLGLAPQFQLIKLGDFRCASVGDEQGFIF